MAGPITWRSIYGQTPDAAARLMDSAQSSFSKGFDALSNVLKKEQETNQQNWDNTKKNNTSEYLDKLAQYRSPDELQAAQASGELDRLKQGYGYQIDSDKVRGALDDRMNFLRETATKQAQYEDFTRGRNEREIIDSELAAALAGDKGAMERVAKLDLMNNAEVMAKIFGIEDGFTKRTYAANAEKRAVNSDNRAAASHALNMTSGQENLAWTREERQRLRNERELVNTADDLVTHTISNWNDVRGQEAAATNELAKSMGIPVVNGIPDLGSQLPGVVGQFQAKLEEQGLGQVPTATQMLREMEKTLRADLRYTEPQIRTALQQASEGLVSSQSLNPLDQGQVDQQLSALDAAALKADEEEKERFREVQRKNIFLQGIDKPDVSAGDVISKMKAGGFDPVFWEGWNRDQVIESVSKIMTKGIKVGDQIYDVPPALLESAFTIGVNDWFDPRQGIEDSLVAFIKANPNDYKNSLGAYKDHKQRLQENNLEKLRQGSRIVEEARVSGGVPYDVKQFLETLKKAGNK